MTFIMRMTTALLLLLLPALVPSAGAQQGTVETTGVTPASEGAAIGPGRAVDASPARWQSQLERINDRMLILSDAGWYAGASTADRRRALRLRGR